MFAAAAWLAGAGVRLSSARSATAAAGPNVAGQGLHSISATGRAAGALEDNDLNNLLRKRGMDVHLASEVKSLDEIDVELERNPISVRLGHFRIRHTPGERARLRLYLLAGGMISCDIARRLPGAEADG